MSRVNEQESAEPQSPAPGDRRENGPPSGDEAEAREASEDVGSEDVREIGGPKGPEPTRYGDWERAGRCIDF